MGLIKNYDEISKGDKNSLKNSGYKGVSSAKKCVNNKIEDFDRMGNNSESPFLPAKRSEYQFVFDSQECINLVNIVKHETCEFISESLMF